MPQTSANAAPSAGGGTLGSTSDTQTTSAGYSDVGQDQVPTSPTAQPYPTPAVLDPTVIEQLTAAVSAIQVALGQARVGAPAPSSPMAMTGGTGREWTGTWGGVYGRYVQDPNTKIATRYKQKIRDWITDPSRLPSRSKESGRRTHRSSSQQQ